MFKRAILAAIAALAVTLPAHADGDAEKGESVFKKCRACHEVGDDAKNKVGPRLNDLFGRTAGTVEDFKYSSAMQEAGEGELIWTEETVGAYLADPRGYIPKNRMAFPGLKKPEEVADVIAYLKQYSSQ
ncbi:cytochrome c family protein [Microbaculum marinum]|uniref:Cytochrome c family protein n=1 Tax=Microbaculum marinum TaxID=1764581 RepID=A0AAW9RRL3_9HYPH